MEGGPSAAELGVYPNPNVVEQIVEKPVQEQKETQKGSYIDVESYSDIVESNREKAKGAVRKAELVAEMRQTREILDVEHPFNQTVKRIVSRLQPERSFDVVVSLSDAEKRLTLLGADTHIISAGFISKFEAYLKDRGRPLTEDHLAMLIAHEMAHGDPEAKKAYLNEKYCDTKGLSLVDKAGFNLKAAVETLEFFEDSSRKPDNKATENIRSRRIDENVSLTVSPESSQKKDDKKKADVEIKDHRGSSNTENRRILGYLIANDSTLHFNGRYIQETPLGDGYDNFKGKTEQWLTQAEARNGIASEADAVREFDNCQNISEVLETFFSTENFNHASISQQFANSKEFERLVLAAAIYRSFTDEHLSLLDKKDFLTQVRSNTMVRSQGEVVVLKADQKPIDESGRFEGYNFREDRQKIIIDILNGKYNNPLELFTLSQDELEKAYPEFNYVKLGDFVQELRIGVEAYKEVLGQDFKDASAQDLLEGTRVALASSFIRSIQRLHNESNKIGNDILGHNVPVIAALTEQLDYDNLNSLIQQSLLKSESCRTPQAAQIIADTFIRSGYHVPAMFYDTHKIKGKYSRIFPDQAELAPETVQDLSVSLFSVNFGLSGGGERSHKGYIDPILMDNFIARLDDLYRGRIDFLEPGVTLYGKPHFELMELLDSTSPSIGGPHGHRSLDLVSIYLRNPDSNAARDVKNDYRAGGTIKVLGKSEAYYETYNAKYAYDPKDFTAEQVEKLVFESVNRRSDLVGAFIASDYGSRPEFVRSIIKRGVQEQRLTPGEIEAMLLKCNNLDLYREYAPFVRDNKREDFYNLQLGEILRKTGDRYYNTQHLVKFIEQGGVVDMTWNKDNLRGIWMNIYDLGGTEESRATHKYTPDEARQIADTIIKQTNRQDTQYSVKARTSLLNVAACLTRYAEGMRPPEGRMEKIQVGEMADYKDKIQQMPASEYRDSYIRAAVQSLMEYGQSDINQLVHLMSMYSRDSFEKYDLDKAERPNNDIFEWKKQIHLAPLKEGVVDVSEYFPFKHVFGIGSPVSDWQDMQILESFAERFDQGFTARTPHEMTGKINLIKEIFPTPGAARDFLIERTMYSMFKGEGQFGYMSEPNRSDMLRLAIEASSTARTRQKFGMELTKMELHAWQDRIDFDQSMQVVMRYLPQPSTERDQLITELLNSSFTTWQQIAQAQERTLGYNYATNERNTASRNASTEYIFRVIGGMPKDDRAETLLFLLDSSKHIVDPNDLSKDFFDEKIETRLEAKIDQLVRKQTQWGWQGFHEEFEGGKGAIEQYLMLKFKGHLTDSVELPRRIGKLVPELTFADVMNCAFPPSLNKEIQEHFASYREPAKAANSLGLLFSTTNAFERRQMIYRLALGNNGFFEDANFQEQGLKTINGFFDLATRDNMPVIESGTNSSSWTDREKEVARKVVVDIFSSLNPARRAELMSRMINLIADSGGQASKEQLMNIALTAFGAVGVKLGQMDAVMPEYLRVSLGTLKENVAPTPKLTVAQRLEAEGRTQYYSGLGKSVGGGSVASAYLARSNGSETDDVVIKMIRPDVVSTYQQDLRVAAGVVNSLAQDGVLKVNVDQVMQEMGQLITEEINPQVEAANIARIQQSRSGANGSTKVGSPELIYTGANHLEMKRAEGISLAKLEQIAEKKARGEALDTTEQQYADVDIYKVYEDIVSDFFHQAFVEGAFHADLHQGNVFVSPDREITEIDHGQIGTETSTERKNALVKYVVGAVLKQPTLIAQAISKFGDIPPQEIEAYLADQPDVLLGVSKFLSQHQATGSINRFTKALINVYPYMEKLKGISSDEKVNLGTYNMLVPESIKSMLDQNATLALMLKPYVTNRAMLMDIARSLPNVLSQKRAMTILPS